MLRWRTDQTYSERQIVAEVLPDDFMMLQADDGPPVRYQSYLLRLRRVMVPAGERCQVYLHDIMADEERYFNSPHELVAYLQGEQPRSGE